MSKWVSMTSPKMAQHVARVALCSASVRAALASLTMIVLKLSIMASRAEDSHIGDRAGDEDGVVPPRAQAVGQIAGALRERAEAPILDDLVFWLDVEVGP
jgi:hypothetical protein